MRIVVMGQAAFGAKTLDALSEKGENVVGVYSPPDQPGGRQDPLSTLAKEKGLPLRQPQSYEDDWELSDFRKLSPDLLVMAFVTDIIPEVFLNVPTHGAICYHPSILPRHRGSSAINWAIMMGDTRTGLTIFKPDGGIDTGPILIQKEVTIGPEDTTGSLYFERLFPMGIEAILESVDQIKKGDTTLKLQDESRATYEPPCDDRVARIDWSRPGREIFNWIRGCDPQPGAYCTCKDSQIRLYGARFNPDRREGASGDILGLDQGRLLISTGDGALEISKVGTPDLGKVGAADLISDTIIQNVGRFE
jgi:methionyl-tRNA formyltransferase